MTGADNVLPGERSLVAINKKAQSLASGDFLRLSEGPHNSVAGSPRERFKMKR